MGLPAFRSGATEPRRVRVNTQCSQNRLITPLRQQKAATRFPVQKDWAQGKKVVRVVVEAVSVHVQPAFTGLKTVEAPDSADSPGNGSAVVC